MSHIFISYSHQDSEYAHKLADSLEQRGFSAWIDDRIDYGSAWPRVIQEHVETCSAFIVIMSQNAFSSVWVQNELIHAQNNAKSIFPLLLEGEVWLSVASTQYVDVRNRELPPESFYLTLGRVVPQQKSEAKPGNEDNRKSNRVILPHIYNGSELLNILSGSHDLVFQHDEFQSSIEAELLSSFAGDVDDFGDVASWGTMKNVVETRFYFSEQINELESNGMYVYAGRTKGKLKTQLSVVDDWVRAIVIVSKRDVEAVFWSHNPDV